MQIITFISAFSKGIIFNSNTKNAWVIVNQYSIFFFFQLFSTIFFNKYANVVQIITFTITYFCTELGFDFLRIYDGANIQGSVIRALSGCAQGGVQTIVVSGTQPSMFIVFRSDLSIVHPGFTATYVASPGNLCVGVCYWHFIFIDKFIRQKKAQYRNKKRTFENDQRLSPSVTKRWSQIVHTRYALHQTKYERWKLNSAKSIPQCSAEYKQDKLCSILLLFFYGWWRQIYYYYFYFFCPR